MSSLFAIIFKALIVFYRGAISPLFSPQCRYSPSCSEYAMQALEKYGPYKGMWLSLKRLSSCHPWGGHGHDPVP